MRKLGRAIVAVWLGAVTCGVVVGVAGAAPPSVSFGAHTEFATGGRAQYVSVAQLNADSFPDLAVANLGDGSVSVLLGNGDGTFGAHTDFATGSGPMSVVAGDVNGDTFLDLVSANYLSDTVSVLLGNGDGTFDARTDFATGSVPVMAKLGDLNGDGMLDVAAANNGSNNVSVLLGNGDGTFATHTEFAAGSTPETVALGDLNGDGVLDLAVANNASDGVSVLLGNGDGTFATHTDFAAGPYQYTVITADLNHDSVLDLAVSHTSGYVSVLLGNGDGTFRAHTDYPVGDGPWSIAVGDVNRDTFPDLVVADYYSVDLLMLLGNGDGTFGTPTDFATARSPITVAVHDLNGDTVPDLVTSNEGGNTVSVLLNLTPAPTVPGAPTIGTAIAGNQSATVSWSAPASNGGSPVTGYVVTPYVGYWPLPSVPFNSTATTQTVTGLTNGTTYRFRVQAVNAIGAGGYSKVTNPVTAAPTVPGVPTIGTAIAGNQSATVSWSAPASNGGSPVTGYVVTPYVGYWPLPSVPFNSTVTTQTVTGLTNGTTYRFRVQAVNAIGVSGYSKVTNPVTPSA